MNFDEQTRQAQLEELLQYFHPIDSEDAKQKLLKEWEPFLIRFKTWDSSYIFLLLWKAFDKFSEDLKNGPTVNGPKYSQSLDEAREICYKFAMIASNPSDERFVRKIMDDDSTAQTLLLIDLMQVLIKHHKSWWW